MAALDTKLRTLYLMDIMLERTDEEHILNATQLCEILEKEYGISTERRTVYSEMEVLEKYGFEVIQKKGTNPGYYIGGRDFEMPELKLLVDAVQSSKFITEKKSRELIRKLEKLCSRSQAKILEKQVFVVNRPKTENETIYYNVDKLHTAIYANKQISFQYVEWTMKKELRFRRRGERYISSPWSLTWDDENYYMVAYDEWGDKIHHYRVDKMQNIEILEEDRLGEEAFKNFDLAEYDKKTFGMYGGRDEELILYCKKELAGVVLDRFGNDIFLIPTDQDHFRAHVKVSVSRQFYGWVTAIGAGMEIAEPKQVREEYLEYLKEVMEQYQV